MATVHLGRLVGPVGFARTVAIKRLHPQYAKDPEFVSMFLDEARLAARIRHPNVVSTLDVVASRGELYLVMDYVQGAPLSQLIEAAQRRQAPLPPPIASAIVVQTLLGLHAAHEARSDDGGLLHVVHRDLSPQNILVGEDGVARVADFGVAKAVARTQSTHHGQLKGKLSYMSPEQVMARPVDRRTDLFAAGAVLWECLTTEKLFAGADAAAIMAAIIGWQPRQLAVAGNEVTDTALKVLWKSLAHDPSARYASALEMARDLSLILPPADGLTVADWVRQMIPELLDERARLLAGFESGVHQSAAPATRSGSPASDVETVVTASSVLAALPTEAPTKVDLPAHTTVPPQPDPLPGRRSFFWVSAGAAAIAIVVALWFVARSNGSTPSAAPPNTAPAETGSLPTGRTETSPPHLPTHTHTGPVSMEKSDELLPTQGLAPGPTSMKRRPPDPPVRRAAPDQESSAKHRPSGATVPSQSNCDPPYTVRPDGLKAYKLECL